MMLWALLATTNQAKRRELMRLVGDLPVRWLTISDLGEAPAIEETGHDFRENALLKARGYAAWSGLPSLADDGGLEIDALGGEPGVRSRRWIRSRTGGAEPDDEELIEHTLDRLRGVPPDRRGASMRVVEAFVLPEPGTPVHPVALRLGAPPETPGWLRDGPDELLGEGEIRGVIAERAAPGRDPGFPFRAVFFLPALGKYYLDLSPEEHEALNHRRVALGPIRQRLGAVAESTR